MSNYREVRNNLAEMGDLLEKCAEQCEKTKLELNETREECEKDFYEITEKLKKDLSDSLEESHRRQVNTFRSRFWFIR